MALRAAVGLAATVVDEVRKLPEELPGLPVRVLGLALQTSLRLQQQYSGLVARGDELFDELRGGSDRGLATFDDDDELPPPPPRGAGLGNRTSSFDLVQDVPEETEEELTDQLLDELADDVAAEVVEGAADPSVEGLDVDDVAVALAVVEGTADELAVVPDAAAADELTLALGDTATDDSTTDDTAPVDTAPVDTATAGTAPDDAVRSDADAALDAAVLGDVTLDGLLEDDAEIDERAARRAASLTDDVVESLPDDPIADAVIDAVEEVADEIGLEAPLDQRVVAAEEHLEHPHGHHAHAGDATSAPGDERAPADAPEAVLDPAAETSDAVSTEVAAALEEVPDTGEISESTEAAVLADDTAGPLGTDAISDSTPTTDAVPDSDPTEEAGTQEPASGTPDADDATAEPDAATDEPEEPVAAGTHSEPVDGYDQFSIASLRGHLRRYSVETVQALLEYEEATRGRAPYVTMLRNRLKRLQADS